LAVIPMRAIDITARARSRTPARDARWRRTLVEIDSMSAA